MKTKILAITMITFGFVVNAQKKFTKNLTVSISSPKELTDDTNKSLNVLNVYKIQLVTTNTSTVTGAEYLAWADKSRWNLRAVNLRGTVSNHPTLLLENNIIKVKTNHANNYLVRAFVTELKTETSRPSGTILGSSAQWQREANNLFYTDGNVGIGTTEPKSKLTVFGASGIELRSSSDEEQFLSLKPRVNVQALNPGSSKEAAQITNLNLQHLVFDIKANDANDSFAIRTDSNYDGEVDRISMVVKPSGNVGIGTTTPSEKLEIKNDKNARIRLETTSTTHSSGISFRGKRDNSSVFSSHYIGTDGDSHYNLKLISDEAMKFQTNSTVKMIITGRGNVGIGTETVPLNIKLGVNGKIAATEVKVATYDNWADFVFKKEYKLPTLTEVENHIKEKGHLENIPSAKEVKKEGFFLGEMDAKLLQKIEELTLYTIDQEKKLNTQNTKIEKLEKENILLKSLLERVSKLEKQVNN